MNSLASRPKMADASAKIGDYDRILVGFPIWWGTAPRIINTFLESYDFSGKTIGLFADVLAAAGMGRTAKELASSCAGAEIKGSRRFSTARPPTTCACAAGPRAFDRQQL